MSKPPAELATRLGELTPVAVSSDNAALLLEPYQAEIGAATTPVGYLTAGREICDRSGALLKIDEVRTGMGRRGR